MTRERLYLDAVEKVMVNSTKILVDADGGNNMLYLPLDKLIQQGSQTRMGDDQTSEEMIDRISNQVIEKLQRNIESTSERRR